MMEDKTTPGEIGKTIKHKKLNQSETDDSDDNDEEMLSTRNEVGGTEVSGKISVITEEKIIEEESKEEAKIDVRLTV
jgi:hypothetical protein